MLVDNLTLIKQYRNRKGRFAKRRTADKRYVWLVGGMLLFFAGAILHDVVSSTLERITQPIVYAAENDVEIVEPRTVLIEVEIDWNEEKIIEHIKKTFPNEPVMVKVAECESTFDPSAFNPTNNSDDKGIFQISTLHHGERVETLGLDMFDVADNVAFAKILYDEQGLSPWRWSKPCWSK